MFYIPGGQRLTGQLYAKHLDAFKYCMLCMKWIVCCCAPAPDWHLFGTLHVYMGWSNLMHHINAGKAALVVSVRPHSNEFAEFASWCVCRLGSKFACLAANRPFGLCNREHYADCLSRTDHGGVVRCSCYWVAGWDVASASVQLCVVKFAGVPQKTLCSDRTGVFH